MMSSATSALSNSVEFASNSNVEFVAPGGGKPNGGCRVAGGGVGDYYEKWQVSESCAKAQPPR